MERIERALEVARLHRHKTTTESAAPAFAPPPPVASSATPAALAPVLVESSADAPHEPRAGLRIENAPTAEIAARELLRERYVVLPDDPGPAAQAYKMLRTQVLQRV